MSWGFVYVLGNDCMPGIYKIGMTEKAPQERLEQLSSSTAVPMPFWMAFFAQVRNAPTVERELHKTFSRERVNDSREFFRISLAEIYDALEYYADRSLIHEVSYVWMQHIEAQERNQQQKLDHFFAECHEPFDWKLHRGFQ
ncbi:T5orf172 domain [Burkholderia pseudomallei]|nr:T5orf172 domain [Burkholderia pseudomallei]